MSGVSHPKSIEEDDYTPIYYDENTLKKVYDALKVAGVEGQQATDAVNQMQNLGILFRERLSTRPATTGR